MNKIAQLFFIFAIVLSGPTHSKVIELNYSATIMTLMVEDNMVSSLDIHGSSLSNSQKLFAKILFDDEKLVEFQESVPVDDPETDMIYTSNETYKFEGLRLTLSSETGSILGSYDSASLFVSNGGTDPTTRETWFYISGTSSLTTTSLILFPTNGPGVQGDPLTLLTDPTNSDFLLHSWNDMAGPVSLTAYWQFLPPPVPEPDSRMMFLIGMMVLAFSVIYQLHRNKQSPRL